MARCKIAHDVFCCSWKTYLDCCYPIHSLYKFTTKDAGLAILCTGGSSKIPKCVQLRPGQQLAKPQRHHADLCKNISWKAFTLYTILLGVGRTRRTEHTLVPV
eukprot:1140888-Pelagomonas_calceolata.AAC.3